MSRPADAAAHRTVRALEALAVRASAPRAGPGPRRGIAVRRGRDLPSGRFDAAETTADNRKHWAGADLLDADADACFATRQILRSRTRHEVQNNPWLRGIALTLANDLVGRGPRLQMLTDDGDVNAAIEREFTKWARAARLAAKLRLMRLARLQDGEAFALLRTNPAVGHAVLLDLTVIEADRVTTPDLSVLAKNQIDGLKLDAEGNVEEYHVLKEHPGSSVASVIEYDRVAARDMIHWFRQDRPEQHRGVPEIASTLDLFADLRGYRKAVVQAARSAASVAGILHTNNPVDAEADEVDPMTEFEIQTNMLVTAPMGWDMTQVKAEQPTTTHDEFVRRCVNEAARPLSMPLNVALCNSERHNYASGRLDHQTYDLALDVERSELEIVGLDPLLDAWMREAARIDGLLPRAARAMEDWPHAWFWRGRRHVDPAKEASAQGQRLGNHTTTLAQEYADQGLDWEEQLRQRGRERALMRALGLSSPSVPPDDDGEDVGETVREAVREGRDA